MTGVGIISSIQREYFQLLDDVLPQNFRELIQRSSRADLIQALAGTFSRPKLFTAYGRRQSSVEVAFDEAARLVNSFWRDRADALDHALQDTDFYGVILETQRFPSRLPEYLRRLALYFDCVGMVDLLHMPETWIRRIRVL